jgi:threonine dehydrogenase-like Zn-dependent dehydrogenase
MKALAVLPGTPGSLHLRDVPEPSIDEVPGGRGVLVRVLRVGVDGTDKEINQAEYGTAPAGSDYLIIGHESFGVVEAVGETVREVRPGDYVVATVRRPGGSFYDQIGLQDSTTDDVYFERGINLRHGYLAEYYVESPDYLVKVPRGCRAFGVLLEPMSIAEKGIAQAYEIQRRLKVWRPRRAAVMGAGTLGLLATMILRLRGLETTTFGRRSASSPSSAGNGGAADAPRDAARPYRNARLVEEIGGRYVSTAERPLDRVVAEEGGFDLIFEATGSSATVFQAAGALAKNGVLVLTSITGGGRTLEIPADRINLEFVLGNKVMVGTVNAHRDHFELGTGDLAKGAAEYPGWLDQLLTHRVDGLENHQEMMRLLTEAKDAIKVFVQVGSENGAGAPASPAV